MYILVSGGYGDDVDIFDLRDFDPSRRTSKSLLFFLILFRNVPALPNQKNPSKKSSLKDSKMTMSCSKSFKIRSLLQGRNYFFNSTTEKKLYFDFYCVFHICFVRVSSSLFGFCKTSSFLIN